MAGSGPTVNVGDVIAGRYRVEAWIGQGHMAVVYQATHEGTGRTCALKLIHSHLVSRPEILDLFLKEARVGGRIGQSPYIVDVFDAAIDEARRVPYLAMELLHGEALDHYLQAHGPMPAATVKILYEQLGEALDQAHAAGVVHRDLKPANLFLTQNRRGEPVLKVVDFGIAKVLELEAQRTATQVGSPAYAAPEQLGQTLRKLAARTGITIAGSVSPASDVWAIGLIAYELLTGLVAGQFWGAFDSLGDLVTRVTLEEPGPASVRAGDRAFLLPAGFDAWLARCLSKDAAARWPSAGDAARALGRLIDDDGDGAAKGARDSGNTVRLSADDLALMGANPVPPPETVRMPKEPAAKPAPSLGDRERAGAMSAPMDATTRLPTPSSPSLHSAHGFFQEPIAPPDHTSSSILPDTGVAGTKIKIPGEKSWNGSLVLAALSILAVLTIVVFVFLPRKGGLRIDVKAEGNASIDRAEIYVDGLKVCDATPCVARDLGPGARMLKAVTSDGRMAGPVQEIVSAGEERAVTLTVMAERAASPPAPPPASTATAALGPTLTVAPAGNPIPDVSTAPPTGTANTAASESPAPSPVLTATAAPVASARLNINAIPVSKILLDGRPLGNTPKIGVSVTAGSHVVVFIHPEHGRKSVTVMLKPGETKTAAVRFY